MLKSSEYARFKRILNAAVHPTFIGRDTYGAVAREGGAFAFQIDGSDVAAALVKTRTSTLMVLSVARAAQGKGIGTFAIEFLRPNWVRALESKVGYFRRLGYTPVGELKRGRSLNTQIMVRQELLTLAGRLSRLHSGSTD